jgi:hypothetical protein
MRFHHLGHIAAVSYQPLQDSDARNERSAFHECLRILSANRRRGRSGLDERLGSSLQHVEAPKLTKQSKSLNTEGGRGVHLDVAEGRVQCGQYPVR